MSDGQASKKKVRDSSRRQHKNIFTLFHFVVNVAQHQKNTNKEI